MVITFANAFGIVALFIGLWGCCISLTKNKCSLLFFTLVNFSVMMVLLVFGSMTLAFGDNGDMYFEDRCNYIGQETIDSSELIFYEDKILEKVNAYENKLKVVNSFGCSF